MCCRYYIAEEDRDGELAEIISALNRRASATDKPLKTAGEVLPTDLVPVIANNRRKQPAPFAMEWGFTIEKGKRMINARSETAAIKPLFRQELAQRRCLVPASWYFEWEKRGREKIRYAIRPEGKDLFCMAGLYRLEGPKPVFTILTREPAEEISFIHDRMPVLLPKDEQDAWLDLNENPETVLKSAIRHVRFGAG